MGRHHNPRYAPEYLERKLNPSGVMGIPVAAEVYIPNTQPIEFTPLVQTSTSTLTGTALDAPAPSVPAPAPGGTEPAPPDGDGDPPIGDPSIPIGPAVPA